MNSTRPPHPAPAQLEAAIATLEAQRALLGDAVVDTAVAPLKAQLAALQRPAGLQRRQVTVLFADVVGSTAMAQGLGSEDTLELLSGMLQRMAAIVEAHQGRVLRYTGDGVKAAFGMDAAREDDAERAVRAGLAIVAAGREQAEAALRQHGLADFAVRVGVHTGDVALGAGVEADNTAMGATVNIAARMEQSAPPGAFRISQDTYAQVRGLFEVQAQEPLLVKGVDAPMQTYLVQRAKPRSFRIATRGIEDVATRMVGRDAELQTLQAAFLRLFQQRRLAAITVVAEAGIGKSRLLYEFEAWSEARPERFVLFRGRATPQTPLQAYGLLRDIFAWRFQIGDDDSVETARRKMEEAVVPLFLQDDGPEGAQAHAHLLGYLIGIEWKGSPHIRGIVDDPRQIRSRALHAAAQIFRRMASAEGCPVLLQLEDLHWSDNETLDFLNQLTAAHRDVPLLLMAFTRPTLFEQRQDWCSAEQIEQGVHQRIDLLPLAKDHSRDLALELLKKLPEVPVALQELLTSRAEGNPFYMEELVKMFIDRGAIQTHGGEHGLWRVDAQRLLVAQVPSTLTGVLQARLDGLPPAEKRALQQASVVGAVFWDQALAAVDERALEQLPSLVQRQLARPHSAAELTALLDGLREYAFSHHLLHQVTYDTVLERAKREGHARVARWIAGLVEGEDLRAGDLLGLAAAHFEWAGDKAQAAEFHTRAAEQAAQRLAHDRVLEHVGAALALLGDAQTAEPLQAELHWRLLWVRENTFSVLARRDEQAADLGALAALANLLDDDRRRAEVAWRRSLRAMRIADWVTQESAAKEGMACALRAGDDALRLHALRLLAAARVRSGDLVGGEALAEMGLAEARRLGFRGIEARLLTVLVIVVDERGDFATALDLNRQSLQAISEIGDRVNEAICLSNLGDCWLKLGELSRAQRDLELALKGLRTNGDRTIEAAALANLSRLALWQGDGEQARTRALQALENAIAAGSRDNEIIAGLRLGDAELLLGRTREARMAFAEAHARALEIQDPGHESSAGLARVALAEGDTAAALVAIETLLAQARDLGMNGHIIEPQLIQLTCYKVLDRVGDPAAIDWLTQAHAELTAHADAISRHAQYAHLRPGYLNNIPYNREIMSAWAKAPHPLGASGTS